MAHRSFTETWNALRVPITVGTGMVLLIFGLTRADPALLTAGVGLVGFSPAARGPEAAAPAEQKLVMP